MPFIRTAVCTFYIAATTVLAAQSSTLEKVLDVRAPIGISAAGNGAYFIATHDGTILEYKSNKGSLRYDRQCVLPPFFYPIDITGSQDGNGSPLAFVVAWSSVIKKGMIARCAESGSSMTILTILTNDVPAGIAYSPSNSSLYYMRMRESELRQIGLDLKNDRYIAQLPSVLRPGAVAVSPDARYLFVADINDHKIVQIELQRLGRSHIVVNAIGYPSAISYNATTGIIYVADFSGRQVIPVNVQTANIHRLPPLRSSLFKGIEGLAPGPTGGLLIADNDANAVFLCADLQP